MSVNWDQEIMTRYCLRQDLNVLEVEPFFGTVIRVESESKCDFEFLEFTGGKLIHADVIPQELMRCLGVLAGPISSRLRRPCFFFVTF